MPEKITAEMAKKIREARADGKATKVIAHEYALSRAQVSGVCTGRFWANAGGPLTNKRETDPELASAVLEDSLRLSQAKCADKHGITLSKVKSIIKNVKLENNA